MNTTTKPTGQFCPLCHRVGSICGARDGLYMLRQCDGGGAHESVLLSWQHACTAAYHQMYTSESYYHDQFQRERGERAMPERDVEHGAAAFHRCMMLRQYRDTHGDARWEGCVGPTPIDRNYATTLLDIGAGAGAFVSMAAAWGYAASGIEPNACMVEAGRRLGRDLRAGGWEDIDGRYDILCAHDVIEHLIAPLEFLRCLADHLEPGGLIVLDTPEWLCPAARREGIHWRHVRPLEHICLYSEGALRELCSRAGLEVEGLHRPLQGRIGKLALYLKKKEEEPSHVERSETSRALQVSETIKPNSFVFAQSLF